ncbi:MAG TPA: hypothetical protein VGF82_22635 [Terracidiphilus sp.]
MRGVLVTAVICLGAGLGVLFAFCHGTTGMQFAYPFSAASLHIDVTTNGFPAVAGSVLSALGAFLLIVATLIALIGMGRSRAVGRTMKRRENAFEE